MKKISTSTKYGTVSLLVLVVIIRPVLTEDLEDLIKCAPPDQEKLNSYLWKIDRIPPSYLFGTIHVPYTQVWDYVPKSTKQAFRHSQNIFFELDLTDHSTALRLAKCQLLPNHLEIKDVLPRSIYRRLKAHMNYMKDKIRSYLVSLAAEAASPVTENYLNYQFKSLTGSWKKMKPIWLMMMLNSLTENDIHSFGIPVLDVYLTREAMALGKLTGAIERVEEQCEPINNLNNHQVLFALNHTLTELERSRIEGSQAVKDQLTLHYKCGVLDDTLLNYGTTLLTSSAQENSSDFQTAKNIERVLQTEMLHNRNIRMAGRIEQLLKAYPDESFFFAFGAGHLFGENNVVEQLSSLEYNVEHVPPDLSIEEQSPTTDDITMSVQFSENPAVPSSEWIRHFNNKKERKQRSKSSNSKYPNFTKLWNRVETDKRVTELPSSRSEDHTRLIWAPSTANYINQSVYLSIIIALVITYSIN